MNHHIKHQSINSYISFAIDQKYQLGICTALNYQIPFEIFKESLNTIFELIQNQSTVKFFLFDKRNLTMVDEPSLKWFYTDWNFKAKKLGIEHQFKILPDNTYFKEKIENLQLSILDKIPEVQEVKFHYIEDIEEARQYIAMSKH